MFSVFQHQLTLNKQDPALIFIALNRKKTKQTSLTGLLLQRLITEVHFYIVNFCLYIKGMSVEPEVNSER